MTESLTAPGRRLALKMIGLQAAILIAGTLVIGLWHSSSSGVAFMVGGLAAWLPQLIFAALAFKTAGARMAKQVMRNFIRGLVIKLLLTVALLGGVLHFANFSLLPLYSGFATVMLAQWLAPVFFYQQKLG